MVSEVPSSSKFLCVCDQTRGDGVTRNQKAIECSLICFLQPGFVKAQWYFQKLEHPLMGFSPTLTPKSSLEIVPEQYYQ